VNIRLHTGLLLAVCTGSGLLLGGHLVLGYRRVESSLHAVGPHSATLKDAQQLQTTVGQWALGLDKVVRGNQRAVEIERELPAIHGTLEALRQASLATGETQQQLLLAIRGDLELGKRMALASDRCRGSERPAQLQQLQLDLEPVTRRLLDRSRALHNQLQMAAELQKIDLLEQRHELLLHSWAATCAYLLVVGIAWYWTTRTLARPIAALSSAAEQANTDSRFELEERGPDEVRRLTRNISAFVHSLQTQKQRTEQEVLERTHQLVHANQAKSAFLATMSHELRTPLNGILNMHELLLGTRLDREQQDYTRTARNAAESLLALINDILDFSKIEAHKLTLESVPFRLRDLVDAAIEILAGVADQKGLELGAVVHHTVPDALIGDPTRIRQILLNLLNNALKFTEQGRVELRVLGEQRDDRLLLRFQVADTGIGIPTSRLAGLFRAFEQVDASTTRKYGGTGLGLAICRELSELMGGGITVASEVGRGSTFTFEIRVGTDPAAPAPALPATALDAPVHVVSRRPLVAERLHEQLRTLGLPTRLLHHHHPDQVAAALAAAGGQPRSAVLLDATGSAPECLPDWPASPAGARPRLAVLDSAVRRRSDGSRPLPAGTTILHEPLRLAHLRDWLLGAGAPTTDQPQPLPTASRALRVLVAEDNPINQRVAEVLLQKAGHQVVLVEDGQQAIERLQQQVFDVVLMDCQMPVLDGWQATARIRALERDGVLSSGPGSHVPIIALTANAYEGERERCLAAGMDEFLSKPFRPRQVIELIDKVLPRAGDRDAGN
jgi:signal transduction histidine kinase/CheY-like chemotaxis protein